MEMLMQMLLPISIIAVIDLIIFLIYIFYSGTKYIERIDSKKKSEHEINDSLDNLIAKLSKKIKCRVIYQSDDNTKCLLKLYPSWNTWGSFHWLSLKDGKLHIYTYNNFFNYNWYNHLRLTNRLIEV